MSKDRVTIRFEIEQEGSPYGIHIEECLQVELESGLWKVTNPTGHASWVGYGRSKHEAILTYLSWRMGLDQPNTLEPEP